MKTAISIPDPLFQAAESLAKRLGISRSQVFQRAIQAFLLSHRDTGITESLNQVYDSSDDPSSVDPLLEKLQLASLPKEDW